MDDLEIRPPVLEGEILPPLWGEDYTTGTGQLLRVHKERDCAGQWCVIHFRKPEEQRDWPTHWREDRRIMEVICPHGVGHPPTEGRSWVHGCDGCCHL